MDSRKEYQKRIEKLREKALSRLAKSSYDVPESVARETREVLQDLHVHQIELEMQNEELRQAQRDLERSRDRYLSLYHGAPVGYVVANDAGMVLQANKTFANMIDRDIAALLNKPLTHSIHVDDRPVFLARFKAFYKNPVHKRLEVRMIRDDQSVIYVKLEGHRINEDADGLSVGTLAGQLLISISNITERKTAETAIVRAKVQWEQTFDAVPDLIAIIDEKETIIRVNKALSNRLGMAPKDCVGKKCHQVLHEEKPRASECPHRKFYRSGKPSEMEAYNRKLSGYFITTVLPFDPGDAENRWCIHISRDITDRKRAEKELLKLRNLESIGKLAGGMAHDFNNILTAVIGHVDLAMLHAASREKQISHLQGAIESAYRARELANRLITFAEGGNQMKRAIDISQLLEATAILTLSGSNVAYDLDLVADMPPLMADEDQMKSAIQNILTNASEAMPLGGKLSLKVRMADTGRFNGHPIRRGTYAKITIRDEGSGIATDDLGKIFDPYFSTKKMGDQKGMGLGLAISHSIIAKHQGHIAVRSEVGVGTTVTLLLPLVLNPTPIEEKAIPEIENSTRNRHKILYMDDEKILWKVIESLLHRMGYDVDFAENGDQAISLFKKAEKTDQPYAALLLDLTIRGGPGGDEVLQKIHQIDAKAKAVVLTGFSSDPVFEDYRKYGFAGALKKPFKTRHFLDVMSRILNLS